MADNDKSFTEIVGNALAEDLNSLHHKISVRLVGEEATKKYDDFVKTIENEALPVRVAKRVLHMPENMIDAFGGVSERRVGNLHEIGTFLISKVSGIENDGVISPAPQTPATVNAQGKIR